MQPITIYPPTALQQAAVCSSTSTSESALPHSTTTIQTNAQFNRAIAVFASIRQLYRRAVHFFTTTTEYIQTKKHLWRCDWMIFQSIMANLNRQADLHRLARWAKRKHLSRLVRAYEWQLHDVGMRLLYYDFREPHMLKRARWLHRLNALITPSPRYYPKGYAMQYSRLNNYSQRSY